MSAAPTRAPASSLRRPAGTSLVLFLLLCAAPASAQRLPLTPAEQAQVDRAIDRGVIFLRATQGPLGTWGAAKETHPIGYAALPGLTLLECDVPASDPIIQRTAHLVRRVAAGKLDGTYEIALSILFLDKLGDPKDRDLIHTLATRLMAGQTMSGGWGYKCPLVGPAKQRTILTALQKLDPGLPFMIPRPGEPGNPKPAVLGGDGGPGPVVGGGRPGIDGRPVDGGTPGPGSGVTGSTGSPGTSIGERDPLTGGTSGSGTGRTPGGTVGPTPGDGKSDTRPASPPPQRSPLALGAPRRGWCIKSSDWSGDRDADQRAWKPLPPPRVADVVPAGLRTLPIFVDGAGSFADPPNRGTQPLAATTDNSNTQFAILALWAAQRHGVPVRRSMDLIVRRFKSSQNADGSWGYRYRFGGGEGGTPAMACVGLLGLAVGHGIAGKNEGPVRDPDILKGMVAVSRHVGQATGRQEGVRLANLYNLWSIERVAVLYNLPTIGGKDWYRWAAEMLVLNQQQRGHWTGGGYHRASPVIDTCFALLILKKANLTQDLADRLPIDAADLERAVNEQVNRTRPAPPERAPDPPVRTTPETPPPEGAPTRVSNGGDKPVSPAPPAPASNDPTPTVEAETGNRSATVVLIILALFALVALGIGLACLVLFGQNRHREEEEEEEDDRPRRPRPRTRYRH